MYQDAGGNCGEELEGDVTSAKDSATELDA